MNLTTQAKMKNHYRATRQYCPNFKHFKSQDSICYQPMKDHADKEKKAQLESQIRKISQNLSEGLYEKKQNMKSRIVVLSKLKMSLKGSKYKIAEQSTFQRQKQKCPVIELALNDSYHKNKLNNNGQIKLVDQQIKKLSLMAFGLQQYESKNQKNKIDKILSLCKKQSEQLMKQNSQSRSFLNPISERSHEIQTVLDEKQQNMQKIKKLLAHLSQKRNFENSMSLPVSPQIKGRKKSNYLKQNKQNTFESHLKNNLSTGNRKFAYKINLLCHEMKNKQIKFNNYFNQMGENFSITNKNNLFSHFDRLKVQDQFLQPKHIYCKNKNYATTRNSLRSSTQKQQVSNDSNNKIPKNFLKQLKNYYQIQKKAIGVSKSKDYHSKRNNLLTTHGKDSNQFSDDKICMSSAKSARNQSKNISTRKDLKICEKIQAIQKQRKQIKEVNKILPMNTFPDNSTSSNLFSEECRYNKIVQYF